MVDESYSIFQEKKLNIKKIGSLLHKSWLIKKNYQKMFLTHI